MYVELPEVGSEVKKGEQFGVIESVKVCCSHDPANYVVVTVESVTRSFLLDLSSR